MEPHLKTLERYATATPALLAERALLRRVDTKFVVSLERLTRILEEAADDYALLLAAGEPLAQYRTLYHDSASYRCLIDHGRGRRPRFKIRIRHYLDRELSYLEIKKKTSADETVKERRLVPFLSGSLTQEDREFVDRFCDVSSAQLIPSLWTNFRRITLVGKRTLERATIDLDLRFEGAGASRAIPHLAIAEIKQARYWARSPIMLALRRARVRPLSLSKYCTAATMLLPEVPMRRYRPKVRALRRLSRG